MGADVNVSQYPGMSQPNGLFNGANESNPDSALEFDIQQFMIDASANLTFPPPREPDWLPVSLNHVRGACLVVISILGASFNAFIIVAIVPNRRLRTVRNILLVHLGAVGFVSSLFTTMLPALYIFYGDWVGGEQMCQTYAYVTCAFTSVSVWTIAALSWDKYQTIASPLHHSLTATLRKMLPCFSIFWVCGLVLSIPSLFGANQYVMKGHMGLCDVKTDVTAGRWYTSILVCLSFIFPFFLMIYCYAHIFRIARTQSSRIAATMLRMVSVIQAPITPVAQSSLSMRGTKAMGTILQLIGSFVLTYLPYAVTIMYEVIFSTNANAVVVTIATTLFLAAPFTHAAIYGIRNQILRLSFYRYSRRKIQRCCAKDKRRASIKNRKPNSGKFPMKCIVKKDGQHSLLRRTLSYQGRPFNPRLGGMQGGNPNMPRPHSFNGIQKMNGFTPSPRRSGSRQPHHYHQHHHHHHQQQQQQILHLQHSRPSSRDGNGKPQKEVSFSEKDEVSYIMPDGVSRIAREETSFYSKDLQKEMSMIEAEMEEIERYDREDALLCEKEGHSVFHLGDEEEDDDDNDDRDNDGVNVRLNRSSRRGKDDVERNEAVGGGGEGGGGVEKGGILHCRGGGNMC